MPKHTWKSTVVTDNGQGPTDSIDLYGSAEQNIGGNAVSLKGLPVGVTDVEEVDLVVTVANIVSFFVKSTTDMRMRINSEVSPAQEFELEAGTSLAWNNASIPQPSSNPLTTNITKFFFFNRGTVKGVTPTAGLSSGLVTASFLLEQESQFS